MMMLRITKTVTTRGVTGNFEVKIYATIGLRGMYARNKMTSDIVTRPNEKLKTKKIECQRSRIIVYNR